MSHLLLDDIDEVNQKVAVDRAVAAERKKNEAALTTAQAKIAEMDILQTAMEEVNDISFCYAISATACKHYTRYKVTPHRGRHRLK